MSAFVLTIGKRQIPTEILRKELQSWSQIEENINQEYRNSTGKLTEGDKSTTAFSRYLQLLSNIGLVRKLGNTIGLTNQGKFVCNILKFYQEDPKYTIFEKLIYIDIFLRYDADTMLCIYEMLKENNRSINQATAQKEFKPYMVSRLTAKLQYSVSHIKTKIAEKKRIIQIEWKEPESYSEHFVAPRLEWMFDLSLVDKSNDGTSTKYQLTDLAYLFFESFHGVNNLKDFTFDWYKNNFFFQSSKLLSIKLSTNKQTNNNVFDFLGEYFKKSIDFVQTSSSFKLPIRETLFFVSSTLLILHKTIIELTDLISALNDGIISDNKTFGIKSSARINEGYITVRLK